MLHRAGRRGDRDVHPGRFRGVRRDGSPLARGTLPGLRRLSRRHGLVRRRRYAGGGAAVRRCAPWPPGAGRAPRISDQLRWRVERPHRPQRPVPAASDPPGAGRRGPVAGRRRRGRGTRNRDEARRPDRGAGPDRHLRTRPGAAAAAGLGQVEHRAPPGRLGRRRGDQDDPGDASRRAAEDAAHQPAVHARGLVGGRGRAADRDRSVAGQRPGAPGRGLVVRRQRHQRAHHPRAAARRRDRGRCRAGRAAAAADAGPGVGGGLRRDRRPGGQAARLSGGPPRRRARRRGVLDGHEPGGPGAPGRRPGRQPPGPAHRPGCSGCGPPRARCRPRPGRPRCPVSVLVPRSGCAAARHGARAVWPVPGVRRCDGRGLGAVRRGAGPAAARGDVGRRRECAERRRLRPTRPVRVRGGAVPAAGIVGAAARLPHGALGRGDRRRARGGRLPARGRLRAGRGAGPADAGPAAGRRDGRHRGHRSRGERAADRRCLDRGGERAVGDGHLRRRGRGAGCRRRLRVSHAFHSGHMDAMLGEFGRVTAALSYAAPVLPLVANLTGELATPEQLCAPGYWVDHVRQAVRFGDGARTLAGRGVTLLLELGPDGTLCAMARDTVPAAVAVPALRRDRGEEESLVAALALVHVNGLSPRWPAPFAGTGARRIDLPTYAFSHQRFWPDTRSASGPNGTPAGDDEFWTAVQEADLATLTASLDVDGDALAKVLPALHDWRRRRIEQATVDSWQQRIVWRPVPNAPGGVLSGTWLAAVPPGHGDDPWVTEVLRVLPAGAVHLEVTEPDRETLTECLRATGRDFTGVVSLLALAEQADGSVPAGLALTTTLVQALGDAGIQAPLWCLTRGAVAVARTESIPGLPQAAIWGFGRVAALE